MPGIDFELLEAIIDRLDTAASMSGGRSNIASWITKNTAHPKNALEPWSFAGHEFQVQIVEETAPRVVIQKAAQKGVSEIVVRVVLALLSKLSGEHAIYVLPSSGFANKFCVSRFDPVIESSDRLKRLISKDVNSSEIKKIGSCFLWIGGAQKEDQAISIPARILVRDEYSFGNPRVLNTYYSRLEHEKEENRIVIDFSTPLYPKMGISAAYELGTKYIYMCFHDRCGRWVEVNSLCHIILPGFDAELTTLDRRDLENPRVYPKEAWVICDHCRTAISRDNLADPSKRAWVAHHPDRDIHSYHVDPLCTASITSAAQIISRLEIYGTTDKWVQYCIGQPFQSADSQIVDSVAQRCFLSERLPPSVSTVHGAAAGMDIGKLSYLSHGRKVGRHLEVFNMETIRQDGDNAMGRVFVDRFKGYRCAKGVIDSEPDVSIVKYAQAQTAYNRVWGSYFVRSARKASLDIYELEEVEGVVKSRRTPILDEFVGDFNAGLIRLPKGLAQEEEIKAHLGRPKRISHRDRLGEESSVWVSSGADHWFFSLFYLWLASKMLTEAHGKGGVPAGTSLMTKAKLKTDRGALGGKRQKV